MTRPHRFPWFCLALWAWSCANAPVKPTAAPSPAKLLPEEAHLADLRQLTFGGQNAEAYWSFDGSQLSFQSRRLGDDCDRIFRMPADRGEAARLPVSSGKGATTCAHFLTGGESLLYASTHGGGDACPPRPDMSQGYVWALYDSYDIYRVKADGTGLTPLTRTPGYDAEGTVCAKDGSIVFTSVRDGDIDLYRMDADGKNVKRLTDTPGYDGGAFFNRDCTKIVWRASRPKPGQELDEYRALLKKGLVHPSKLELWVANADGTDPVQVTRLDAASFAPFWFPDRDRIVFSSNVGDPKGREFDLWAVNADGTGLERITYAAGFDGFPMFSPDGKTLAFSSNRATAPGAHDTNVFVARWVDSPVKVAADSPADRARRDVAWLADPAREGRGIGTAGLAAAGDYLEARFKELGLAPASDDGSYRQPFPAATGVTVGTHTAVSLGGAVLGRDDFAVPGYSAQGDVAAPLVLAGYGIVEPSLGVDDYARANAKGKVVVVRRFVPDSPAFAETEKQRRYGDLRYKAWVAREHGAKALVVVDLPEPPRPARADWRPPTEAGLPASQPEGPGDAGLPVLVVKRSAIEPLVAKLASGTVQAKLKVALQFETKDVFNVVGRLAAGAPPEQRLPGVVVVGAHYDHLGYGGRDSLAPEKHEPHLGADDNASGTAAVLEVARLLAARKSELRRDVVFALFTGEESGALGSSRFTRSPPGGVAMKDVVAMLNLDMVGRLRGGKLAVLGTESAEEWNGLLPAACERAGLECAGSGDGYGPSDETPFYAAGVPVLFFFTGVHSDYHKPSDTADRVNETGLAMVASLAADLAVQVDEREARLTYKKPAAAPLPRGDLRSFNASLGTIPDYSGPPKGTAGVLLSGVRPGGAADLAGLKRGDILTKLGSHSIGSVEDLMYALNAGKPGETVSVELLRDGKALKLEATFQESKRK